MGLKMFTRMPAYLGSMAYKLLLAPLLMPEVKNTTGYSTTINMKYGASTLQLPIQIMKTK